MYANGPPERQAVCQSNMAALLGQGCGRQGTPSINPGFPLLDLHLDGKTDCAACSETIISAIGLSSW